MTGHTSLGVEDSYPKLCCMVVNGRVVEGICNSSADVALLSGSAGPRMPSVLYSRHFTEPPFKPRLVSG